MNSVVKANEAGEMVLRKQSGDKWAVHTKYAKLDNLNLVQAIDYLESQGAEKGEVYYAIDKLFNKNHTVARFGVFGSFIFTEQR